ncbi:hypothetical protein KP509_1Z306200 [Ceratopteris richardii]|nr:hypothetical protein KP509_1Z306200 [Ceratopteris richardii]
MGPFNDQFYSIQSHIMNVCIPNLVVTQLQDVGAWLEGIGLGGYKDVFTQNHVTGEYLDNLSSFTTEEILGFIRKCHMKWGDFITLCKELRRVKVACLRGEQEIRRPWWAPPCFGPVFCTSCKA